MNIKIAHICHNVNLTSDCPSTHILRSTAHHPSRSKRGLPGSVIAFLGRSGGASHAVSDGYQRARVSDGVFAVKGVSRTHPCFLLRGVLFRGVCAILLTDRFAFPLTPQRVSVASVSRLHRPEPVRTSPHTPTGLRYSPHALTACTRQACSLA